MDKKATVTGFAAPAKALRLGFVPLTDCAPLVMARELGLYKKYGLRVELSRELGWATIRDKIIHRELDAAHALAAMPVAATFGLGSVPCDCLTGLVLNLHGNAITLSADLWKRGVRDGRTLREEIHRSRREKIYTFGVVFPFSSHRHLLLRWFAAHGIDPVHDVRIVVVPPPQMVANLKTGNLDGFCVGEPWNSVAVQSRAGWIIATSAELDAFHPEKVLMVRADFAARRSEEHIALIAALLEACEFCEQPENHARVVTTLSRPEYIGVTAEALRHGIDGQIDFGYDRLRFVRDFCVFHRDGANEPSGDKAAWALRLVRDSGFCPDPAIVNFSLSKKIFRSDIYEKAIELRQATPNPSDYDQETVLS